MNRSYALTSLRRHVGGQSHCLVDACDLCPAHRWQLRLRIILCPPRECAMRLWRLMRKIYIAIFLFHRHWMQTKSFVIKVQTQSSLPQSHKWVLHIQSTLPKLTLHKSNYRLSRIFLTVPICSVYFQWYAFLISQNCNLNFAYLKYLLESQGDQTCIK